MKDKIYYFQEKSNDILDLQDELTAEEIGIYFILKAGYFKYAGELREENLCQRCKFFGSKEKLNEVKEKIFEVKEGLLVNNAWLSEIQTIKDRSVKRREAAMSRWNPEEESKTEAKQKQTIGKNPAKPKKTQSDLEITELVEGLQFILEAKLNKKINTSSWKEPIRLLVEKDLAQRENAIEDVKRAIQEVGNRFGEQYFPVIQSGGSLREKFSKIENAMRKIPTKGESTIANIMEDF